MKLTNANKAVIVLLITSISACRYRPEKEMVTGTWKYLEVTRADTQTIEISDNDYLQIRKDSSFQYRIESINKRMKGRWDYSDHVLHLHYQEPDTTRHFEIDLLTKDNLHFHEGEMVFRYVRID